MSGSRNKNEKKERAHIWNYVDFMWLKRCILTSLNVVDFPRTKWQILVSQSSKLEFAWKLTLPRKRSSLECGRTQFPLRYRFYLLLSSMCNFHLPLAFTLRVLLLWSQSYRFFSTQFTFYKKANLFYPPRPRAILGYFNGFFILIANLFNLHCAKWAENSK